MNGRSPTDDLPRPPERPEPAMCCGRGCCPCIHDYYDDALARWQGLVRERGHDPAEVMERLACAKRLHDGSGASARS